jgi:hypothetical protein
MQKRTDAIRIKIHIKKARSKNHCKTSRNERRKSFVYEVRIDFEDRKPKRFQWKKIFSRFFKPLKFIAKLAKKVIVAKMFGL